MGDVHNLGHFDRLLCVPRYRRGRGGSDALAAATSPAAKSATDQVAADGNVAHLAKGYIVPVHRILVSPKVNGMIVKLDIIEGKRVEKGDLLAMIEDIDYKADVARAEATGQLMRDKLAELAGREPPGGDRPEQSGAGARPTLSFHRWSRSSSGFGTCGGRTSSRRRSSSSRKASIGLTCGGSSGSSSSSTGRRRPAQGADRRRPARNCGRPRPTW